MTRIAAIQMNSTAEVEANLQTADRLLTQAANAGVELAVLPENAFIMPLSAANRRAAAEKPGAGRIQSAIAEYAQQLGLWVIAGTLPMQTDDPKKLRSACLVFDDKGECKTRYDKIHLFDVDLETGESHRESNEFQPGDTPVVVETSVGHIGLSICYDLRFPELYRKLRVEGASQFTVPSAFTVPTGRAHWQVLLRARAIENLAYVIAPAQVGHHTNGRETYGHSMIIDPWGKVLAELENGEGMIVADIDHQQQAARRRQLPALEHRRIDIG